MGCAEGIEPWDQPAHHEGRKARNYERSLRRLTADLGRGRLQQLQGLSYRGQERRAGRGEFNAAIESTEQRNTEIVLKRFDLPTYGAMREVKLLSCGADAAPA